ncbi:MAG: 4-hydroxyphenylpyruvate dioxygenase [Candidatus Obscuribacter phosphatis]|uniref:4-hydroxyphenylpyruvate dioxygenase n=1 Tax=Candidatus Obscuribacter phosphatis TaxID=1906157 RepID=A0A8J7P6K9_9BACT|nr:4-hydroxyphenylpyruvate dioxygenase [Candidatus Obscuribacter phosphatis]
MAKEATKVKEENPVQEINIDGFDYVEFYVGNALQASYYYNRGFGFDIVGYKGLETGSRDTVSYVLEQDHVKIVLTGSMNASTEVAEHVKEHGDGVKSIGMRVRDVKASYETAVARGAKSIYAPKVVEDEHGTYVSAAVATYGDTVHTFIDRSNYKGFAPGFKTILGKSGNSTGLVHIDHIVGNVEADNLQKWVDFYSQIFGFHIFQYFDAEDISTKYSALVSKVMANKSGTIKMPINEPYEQGLRKSQIQEYIDYYNAPGVQHIAITTRDIIKTVGELRKRGVEFLTVPMTYYETLKERVGEIDEDINELAKLGILVDRESEGYLLQIFTKPVQDRPTLFFEIIQRKGATGFGKGNFMALFESIEREQAQRGNL